MRGQKKRRQRQRRQSCAAWTEELMERGLEAKGADGFEV